ncbi:tumor necrosis factor ligand superfamily member 10-like [Mercenaria mercenaria]|uniref:tumor necrosis factor ligand superfamily member 10-like n=1 Tax=Mercenaria mercenaria TaxID=6596 RepID=UPI00234ED928|nr:tumor necrosis factor ligand superfamily member 10-like [Mercenaria mercenaria]
MRILYIVTLYVSICLNFTNAESSSMEKIKADLKRDLDLESSRLESVFDRKLNELKESIDARLEILETGVNLKLTSIQENVLTEVRQDSTRNNGSGQGFLDTMKNEMDKHATVVRNAISSEKQYLRDNIKRLHSMIRKTEETVEENIRAAREEQIKIEESRDTGPSEVPAAHLMGSTYDRMEYPGMQLFPIVHWISQEAFAFTRKVQYRFGRIVISEEGLYYVYSQLSFLEVFDNPRNIETGSLPLSHYIYRYNFIYPRGGEESMIQSSITKCWGQNQAFGEYTSYLGAVFHLRQGDELFVKVSNLTLIVREPKLNYFGLFKVN